MEVLVACAFVIAAFLCGVTLGMSIERQNSVRSCLCISDTATP